MTQKPYSEMNAREKTEFIGFKMYSERELNERTKKTTARRSEATKRYLAALVANPAFVIGKTLTEKELAPVFQEVVNTFHDEGISKYGLTTNDVEAIVDNIIQIGYMLKRSQNEANTELMRLAYALTGENSLGDVPLKDVIATAKIAKDIRPRTDTEYDNEPSLSQTMVDKPEEAAK